MSLRARRSTPWLVPPALALALCLPAVGAAAPLDTTTVSERDEAPQVLSGMRPGPGRLQCNGGSKLHGVFDYGSPRAGTAQAPYRTPAQTVRRFLADERDFAELRRLTYERRAPQARPKGTPRGALFVGLRRDGTVKAQIELNKAGGRWRVNGVGLCGDPRPN